MWSFLGGERVQVQVCVCVEVEGVSVDCSIAARRMLGSCCCCCCCATIDGTAAARALAAGRNLFTPVAVVLWCRAVADLFRRYPDRLQVTSNTAVCDPCLGSDTCCS